MLPAQLYRGPVLKMQSLAALWVFLSCVLKAAGRQGSAPTAPCPVPFAATSAKPLRQKAAFPLLALLKRRPSCTEQQHSEEPHEER